MDDFERIFKQVTELAPQVFLKDEMHTAVLQVSHGTELHVIQAMWHNDEEKAMWYRWLEERFGGQARFYVWVLEGWAVLRKAALDEVVGQLRPSLNPDRIEILQVIAAHRDGRQLQKRWVIKREPLALDLMESDSSEVFAGQIDAVLLGGQPLGLVTDKEGRIQLP